MKTLADFKRLGVGTQILTVKGAPRFVGVVRKIAHKQTNAIKFEGGSWLEYPRADETIVDGDVITISSKDKKGYVWNVLQYKVLAT